MCMCVVVLSSSRLPSGLPCRRRTQEEGLQALGVRARLGGDLVLGAQLAADLGAGQDILAVLVELELGDDDVGGVEAQGDALAGGLIAGDALNVDDVFEAVDRGDLALTALVGATDNGDLVVLADGDAADLFAAQVSQEF